MRCRILHVVNNLQRGGAERQLSGYLRNTGIHGQRLLSLTPALGLEYTLPAGARWDVLADRQLSDAVTVARLARKIANDRPYVVCFWAFRPYMLGWIATRLTAWRPRCVANVRSAPYFHTRFQRRVEQVALRSFDAVVANSSPTAEHLRSGGIAVQVIPNAVEVPSAESIHAVRQRERTRLGVSLETRLVATVGQAKPVKGFGVLLEAAETLRAGRPNVSFLWVGRGIDALVGHRPGHVVVGETEDVIRYLAAADAYVLPSLSEGMPNALMEAMATGLPCVATRVGGVTDIMSDNVEGLLVEPGAPGPLAAALAEILDDRQVAERLGRAARARMERDFSVERSVKAYDALFRALCECVA